MSPMWRIRQPMNQLATAQTVDVEIYGVISSDPWYDEIGINNILEALEGLDGSQEIVIHINSVGGEVAEGVTIYNRLKALANQKTVIVEGLAASIASIIAMAGDTIHMALGSQIMIHNPACLAIGDSGELRKAADVLDKVKTSLMDIYAGKTGIDRDKLSEMMNDETWLTASEALELGFCNTIDESFAMVAQLGADKLIVNGIPMSLAAVKGLPIDTYEQVEEKGDTMDLTLDTLKAEYGDIYNAVLEEGRKQERERLQVLDELMTPERAEAITKAKYETFATANDIAIDLLKAQPAQAPAQTVPSGIVDRLKDAQVLNGLGVKPTNVAPTDAKEERQALALNLINEVTGGDAK